MERHLQSQYGAENVTSSTLPSFSQPNVRLAGKELSLKMPSGETINIPFDSRGFPIFDRFSIYETRLQPDLWQIRDRVRHFKAATLDLKKSIDLGSIPSTSFNEAQLGSIMRGESKIPGFTWHHDQHKLQLVPEFIHNHPSMRHVGGYGMAGK
jgi:filamentous hemagglutinin